MFQFRKLSAGFSPLLVGSLALCLMLVTATPAAAATVEERLTALESKVENLQGRVSTLETKMVQQTALNNVQTNQILSLQATVQKQQTDNVAQSNQIAALANKLIHVTRVGNSLVIRGANLHIVNGLDQTESVNGLGNLIVGYNEVRETGDLRTGSHNLVVGVRQNF